jgi:hypothetical protein
VTLKLLPINTASAQHRAWASLLIVMLLHPIWSSWGPMPSIPVLPSRVDSIAQTTFPAREIRSTLTDVRVAKLILPARSTLITPGAQPSAESWELWLSLLICYFAGVSVMAIRLIVGTIRAWSVKRGAIVDEEMLVSSRCAVSITLSLPRPAVILPQNWRGWSEAKLDAVLIHESEHVWRRDPPIEWLAQFNRAIFWFHSLARWLDRKLATLAETANIALGYSPYGKAIKRRLPVTCLRQLTRLRQIASVLITLI